MRTRYVKTTIMITMMMTFILNVSSFADENVEALKAQIETLQKRVEELEDSKSQKKTEDDDFFRSSRMWDPFNEIQRMQEEMNQMFQHSFDRSGLNQGVFSNDMSFDYEFDIKEDKDKYEVIFNMSGLDDKNLDVQIKDRSITVKGQHSAEQKEENENNYFQSKSYGTFLKTIPVPADADTSKANIEKKGEQLIIMLPKKSG